MGGLATNVLSAEAKTAKGGASELMKLKPIKTGEDLAALKPGDRVVHACPKCKDIFVTRVEKESKPFQAREVAGVEHLCPGCGNKITTSGHGKSAKDVVTHVCRHCGSADAFCSVMKSDADATKGKDESKGKK